MPIPGARLLQFPRSSDSRGAVIKPFDAAACKKLRFSISEVLVSRNHKGVFRGLHYQKPKPQAKIAWCARGRIYDIMLDMRRKSKAYGKWLGLELSEANGRGVFLPEGIAHGFLSLEEGSEVVYLLGGPRSADCERGVLYTDPEVGIMLPKLKARMVVSKRDLSLPPFRGALKF